MLRQIFVFLLVPAVLWANPISQPHVTAELVAEVQTIQPGQPFWVALVLRMEEGWHTYYKEPGDSGMPTSIEWVLPRGFTASEIYWPEPERIETPPLVNFGYHGEVLLLTKITPPETLQSGIPVSIRAKAAWLVCKEICLPGAADLNLTLSIQDHPPSWNAAWKEKFDQTRKMIPSISTPLTPMPETSASSPLSVWSALVFALVGGVILNLMPCVFPVLSIKILNFVQQSGKDKRKLRLHGLIFGAGVLASFWVLAGVLLLLRAGGEELGWGFQLQSPLFVACITVLLFVLSLNLFGVFEMGTSLIGAGARVGREGFANSFWNGVLATIVATPCTAPLMGVALAFALAQPAWISLIVFTALGMGLALPYVVLSFSPALLKFLPKPGAWMESFKQAMAFPLLGAVVWLVWVLGWQTGNNGVLLLLTALLFVSLSVWAYGRWGHQTGRRKNIALVFAGVFLLLSFGAVWKLKDLSVSKASSHETSFGIAWETFSPEKVAKLRRQNKPVFIDFTAAWCATCQVNKAVAFNSAEVREKFRELGVVALKADWTNRDPVITRALESFGRSGVPLYVLYVPGRIEPILLPELLNPGIVLKALEAIP